MMTKTNNNANNNNDNNNNNNIDNIIIIIIIIIDIIINTSIDTNNNDNNDTDKNDNNNLNNNSINNNNNNNNNNLNETTVNSLLLVFIFQQTYCRCGGVITRHHSVLVLAVENVPIWQLVVYAARLKSAMSGASGATPHENIRNLSGTQINPKALHVSMATEILP